MRADGFSAPFQLPPLLPLNLATFDFGLSFSPLASLSLSLSLLPFVQSHAQRPDPKKPEAPSLRRVLLPVAHPKNIPRLIQPPPYCAHQPRAQWFSPPLTTTCGASGSRAASPRVYLSIYLSAFLDRVVPSRFDFSISMEKEKKRIGDEKRIGGVSRFNLNFTTDEGKFREKSISWLKNGFLPSFPHAARLLEVCSSSTRESRALRC